MLVTPAHIEKRLLELSKEIDEAQQFLDESENEYFRTKAECEIALAEQRLKLANSGIKMTVQEKEDTATVACAHYVRGLATAEAKVRAARGNANRIRVQVDITRSIGTSVRSALDV